MKKVVVLCVTLVSMFFVQSNAQPFNLVIDSDEVTLWQSSDGQRITLKDSGFVAIGDSIILSSTNQATLHLENSTRILVKGPSTLHIGGIGNAPVVSLDDGQLFLDRNQPYTFDSLILMSKGYRFVPLGTSVGIKTTRQGVPTTAVVRGSVRMQGPSGENIVVSAGSFATIDANWKIVQGKLAPRAISALESWAGLTPAITEETSSQEGTDESAPAPVITQPVSQTPEVPVQVPVSAKNENINPVKENSAQAPALDTKAKESKNKLGAPASATAPKWEIGAGVVTVDDEQWTRLAVGVDVPIWKFGVFFDVELFIDGQGKVSDKGWDFKNNSVEAVTRKIRYVRFGQEQDPVFAKVGGLSSVTLGYGFLVDRFTNMLHYPDQRQFGVQFNLNDITPIGLTLQTVVGDLLDLRSDGGVAATRLAITPLRSTGIPIVNGISVGGTYATDFNEYAPARTWDYTLTGFDFDRDMDNIVDGVWQDKNQYEITGDSLTEAQRSNAISKGIYDTLIEDRDKWASRLTRQFALIGGDIGVPIIRTSLLSLDIYGQAGMRPDGVRGWGVGAPGVALKVWQLSGNVEYRHIRGAFEPGYFGPYYLDERLVRDPIVRTKSQTLKSKDLDGIFGQLGFNIANVLLINGTYQYLTGKSSTEKDQRFEMSTSVGDLIISKIPRLKRAEAYLYKTNIGGYNKRQNSYEEPVYDGFFEKTPSLYYGYRAGIEIAQGATLVWDSRYGYKPDVNGKLRSNNNIRLQTEITF